MTTTTAPRYSVDKIDGDWTVIRTDATGRQGVGTFPSREAARQDARERNARQDEIDPSDTPAGPAPDGLGAREMTDADYEEWAAELQAEADAQAPETAKTPRTRSTGESQVARKLQPGDRIVLRGVGQVSITRVAKVKGQQKVAVTFTQSGLDADTRQLWVNSRYSLV